MFFNAKFEEFLKNSKGGPLGLLAASRGGRKGLRGKNEAAGMKGSLMYLNECSYSVDLEAIYKIHPEHGTCTYNDEMEYVPIQLKVECDHTMDAKYLVQVWNKFGRIVFEK